jgi:hypothetical protein
MVRATTISRLPANSAIWLQPLAKLAMARLDCGQELAGFATDFIYSPLDTPVTASGGVVFCHRYGC